MFWLLRQSLQGKCSVGKAFWGVLWGGSLLVALFLGALLFLFVLPNRSEGMVPIAWIALDSYVFLAAIGVWRSSTNAKSSVGRILARIVSVAYAIGLSWHVFLMMTFGYV